jgi:hypothetical protein
MTISTADGAASIARAQVKGGPCTTLLIRSAGEAGIPTSYGAVQVTYNGPYDQSPLPLCIVDVTSILGQTEGLSIEVTSREHEQACCPYGTCCPKESLVTRNYRVEFKEPTQTISFPPPPDGGLDDVASDAAQLAPEVGDDTRLPDLDAAGVDGTDIDATGLDTLEIDAPTIDSTQELDLAVDA